jgi:formylglycine-generating enzyme required for sulfatase activity
MVIGLAVVIGSIMVTSAQDLVMLSIVSPSDGETVDTNRITVSGNALGAPDAAVKSVTVNGALASGTAPGGRFTSWMSEEITLQPGPNMITVIAIDTFGNTKTKIITVFYNTSTHSPTPTPTPTPPPAENFTNTIGMEFVLIPAGEFEMGSPSYEPGRLYR